MAHTAIAPFDPSVLWTAAPASNCRSSSSARLHLQHFLSQRSAGHLLSPILPQKEKEEKDSDPLRVADLGCGNGAWLCALHDEFVQTGVSGVQLDGYDINPSHFPAPEFLPSAVRLSELDVLQPPAPELEGVYDVVHVRAFASTLAPTDVAPLLSTVRALLKPGGYLQWEEAKADEFVIEPAAAGTPSEACTAIARLIKAGQDARGRGRDDDTSALIDRLDQVVLDHGFDDVLVKVFPSRARRRQQQQQQECNKGWTEDLLVVWGELADLFPPRAKAPFAPVTRESFRALFRRAVAETEQGVGIRVGKITIAVGRKPLY
ncbi:S-adenosyl-L-methionine-dependent methyltransferase [Apiospora marii]|uniref:S-adenosyl-L-methionine-dependent methyltransferase n=1 Tax=Apiospora marii TaxID=335849 RepID=UPI003130DFC5